jgi:hypothetical protein
MRLRLQRIVPLIQVGIVLLVAGLISAKVASVLARLAELSVGTSELAWLADAE